jgi:hypothetical protein
MIRGSRLCKFMSSQTPSTTHSTPDPSGRREHRDISVKGVASVVVGLAIFGVALHLALAGLATFFKHQAQSADKPATINRSSSKVFPAPQLQLAPREDLAEFRAREDRILNSYGWIDKTSGIVRIPISRAMELLAARGLSTNGSSGASAPKSTYELIKDRSAQR